MHVIALCCHRHRSDDMLERNSVHIKLHDVDPTALRQLVDYTYTGDITITEDNVQVTQRSVSVTNTQPNMSEPHAHTGAAARLQSAADPVGA